MNETTDPAEILPLIFLLFPLGFALLWTTVLTITARLGGWHGMAQSYPDDRPPESYEVFMTGGRMGWTSYSGVLKLHADTRGLHIAVILPFRPGHAPACIPWHALQLSEDSELWIPMTRLEIQRQGHVIANLMIRSTVAAELRLSDRVSS